MNRIAKKSLLIVLSLLLVYGVLWQFNLTGASIAESNTKIKGSIYTNASYSERSQDKTTITVTGVLPEDVEVRAYPVKVKVKGSKVLAAYDISLYRPVAGDSKATDADNVTETTEGESSETEATAETADTKMEYELYEPTEPVTVNIRPENTVGQNKKYGIYYVPESGTPQYMPTTVTEDAVSFKANHFSVYALTASAAMSTSVSVNTFAGLQTNIATGGTKVIQLSGNITATGTITIPADSNITIDLNGYSITSPGTLFQLNNSTAALTITDSRQGTETTQTVSGNDYGNLATAANSSGKITLNYYVTKTAVTNASTGATAETTEKHTVTTSAIISNSYTTSIVSVTSGTFNMTGGMLYGGKKSAIDQTGGIVNLSDGYICGVDAAYNNNDGGAVKMTAGTLNISGNAVLAGNTGFYGGAVYASAGTVAITGGVISGNTAKSDGGGIYICNATSATMSGGYLTNNVAKGSGWANGGGGAFVKNSSFTLSGGYITGNAAVGGGGLSTDYSGTSTDASVTSNSGTIYIKGGFVTANVATASVASESGATANEGGGLSVHDGYYGEITGGHITNNITQTTDDWGGGGIFIGEHGTVVIKNLLMTDNTAVNYGGGVASCSTGNLYFYVDDGAAIYDNTAVGTDPTYGNAKPEAYEYCVGNTVFQSNGYADLFSCNNSVVMGEMLGGGAANWSGSKSDGPDGYVIPRTVAITIGKDEFKSATYLMGLTSAPSDEDIAKAQAAALVYINGNTSSSNGGGIMTNGNLVLGTPQNLYNPISLALNGSKTLKNASGTSVSLSGYTFKFNVKDSNGTVVSTGTSDANGSIVFSPMLNFTAPGSYTYIIEEQSIADYPEITFDTKQYRITVSVGVNGSGTPIYDGTRAYNLKIASITRATSTDGGVSWSTPVNITVPASANSTVTLSAATSGLAFANTSAATTSISVKKTWSDCVPADSIRVQLYANGVAYGNPVVVTADDDWFHLWTHLLKYDSNGKLIVYTVKEIPIDGYDSTVAEGTPPTKTISTTTQNWTKATSFQDGATYLLVSSGGALANTSGDLLSWAANTSGDAANTPLTSEWVATAKTDGSFKLTNKSSGRVLTFVNTGTAWVVRAYANGDSATAYDSGFTYVGSQLRSSPNAWYFDSAFNYGWTINAPMITLYNLKSTTTVTTVPVSDKHFNITNTASAPVYELPATGGSGTLPYLFVGLVLIVGSSLTAIIWKRRQRRWGKT